MTLLSILSSTVAFATLASARIQAYQRCASPDVSSIPCEAGHACAFVNSTFSFCIPSFRGGSAAAGAARHAEELGKRSGDGGQVNLVNGTPYKWVLDGKNSYQLNNWDFPAEVAPFSTASVYVEWASGLFLNTRDSAGEANYHIDTTDRTFSIHARADGGYRIEAVFTALSTPNNDVGATVNLGWVHDGATNFALSGADPASFISSNPPEDWMTRSLATFGDTPLGKFVLPASHDSGMSVLDGYTAAATHCNTLTQTLNIRDQLARGARYFDIRPVISAGVFKTGHYSKLDISQVGFETAQGGNGESIDNIISAINDFQKDKKELVVLNLSHDFNTDEGNSEYRGLNDDEWKQLFNLLKGLNNLYHSATPDANLMDLTLNTLLANSSAVIIVTESGGNSLGDLRGQGFFTYDQFGNAFNSYSDSDDLDTMVNDQLAKMHDHSGEYMLLSWTLTQKFPAVIMCPASPSIIDLANKANAALYARILNEATKDAYPKLVYIDNFASSDMVPLVLGINYKVRS